MIAHLVQLDIAWEDKTATFARICKLLETHPLEPDSLVVLPEMFSTGFSMNVPLVQEGRHRLAEKFMIDLARTYRCTVVGGVVNVDPSGRAYNQALAISPDGCELARFNKLHPFGNESQHYTPGQSVCLFDWQGAKVAPLVCYDLRFPESFRAAVQQGADLFVVIANWPTRRIAHWNALLPARAIENLAHVIAVNRVGQDPYHAYPGQSQIISHYGQLLTPSTDQPMILTAPIDLKAQQAWRNEFPALKDIRPSPNCQLPTTDY